MKRFFFRLISFIAVTATVAINLNLITNNDFISSIVFDNVEALADETVRGMVECYGDGQLFCYVTNTCEYNQIVIYQ